MSQLSKYEREIAAAKALLRANGYRVYEQDRVRIARGMGRITMYDALSCSPETLELIKTKERHHIATSIGRLALDGGFVEWIEKEDPFDGYFIRGELTTIKPIPGTPA